MKHPDVTNSGPAGSEQPDSQSAALEAEPAVAADLFGAGIGTARDYAAHLASQGEELGLIGPLELPRLWTRHLLNCVTLAPLLRPGRVGDVGSGAGLPGLVLAIACPESELVLIEPMERRVDWLRTEAERLGLNNVTVERARGEDSMWQGRLDQVTARAVSALSKLGPMAAKLLRPGGELLLLKGARAQDEVDAAQAALRRAGVTGARVQVLGEGVVPEPTRVVRATLASS